MTINLSENTLDKQFIQRLATLEKAVLDLKTKQDIGSDVINVSLINADINFTLAPNTRDTMRISFFTDLRQYFLSEMGVSVYLGVDNDGDHLFPDGHLLSAAEKGLRRELTYDQASSDEVGSGGKSYLLSLWNPSTTDTLTIFLKIRVIYPKLTVTSVGAS